MVFTFINRIRNDDGGQVIIWYALVTLTLVAFVITVADITSWTARKIHLQTSVDAAAFSGAVWQARAMNMISVCNLGIVACYAIMAIILIVFAITSALCVLGTLFAWTGLGGLLAAGACSIASFIGSNIGPWFQLLYNIARVISTVGNTIAKFAPLMIAIEPIRIGVMNLYSNRSLSGLADEFMNASGQQRLHMIGGVLAIGGGGPTHDPPDEFPPTGGEDFPVDIMDYLMLSDFSFPPTVEVHRGAFSDIISFIMSKIPGGKFLEMVDIDIGSDGSIGGHADEFEGEKKSEASDDAGIEYEDVVVGQDENGNDIIERRPVEGTADAFDQTMSSPSGPPIPLVMNSGWQQNFYVFSFGMQGGAESGAPSRLMEGKVTVPPTFFFAQARPYCPGHPNVMLPVWPNWEARMSRVTVFHRLAGQLPLPGADNVIENIVKRITDEIILH